MEHLTKCPPPDIGREASSLGNPVRGEAAPSVQPKILVVDDDVYALEVQMRMLRSMGYLQCAAVARAKKALRLLERDSASADLIVCDLSMPEMDGIEFLQALNATAFHGSVILHSAHSPRVMHSVQKLLGGSQLTILGALTKPAGRDAFRALIDCWRPQTRPPSEIASLAVSADELHLANRERQWVLHYQPQVNLRTGALVGMEALVRWNHPVHGLLYPDRFIGLAEDCGAIDGLTDCVVRGALGQRERWFTQGLAVQMAVNVSMESLGASDFWRRFGALVQHAHAEPQDVTIEVTESRILTSSAAPLENLVRLRLQHFTLSIDDFGTGHSSLAQLRDMPFNELKVDRGFVFGARDNQIIRPILEGSLGIARRMDMKSVAEGVETEADWRLLRELDCDLAQGYFIARPMDGDSVWDWLSAWRGRVARLVGR